MKKLIMVLILLVTLTSMTFAKEEPVVETFGDLPQSLRGAWTSAEQDSYNEFLFLATSRTISNQYGVTEIKGVEKQTSKDGGFMYIIFTADKKILFFLVFQKDYLHSPVLAVYKDKKKVLSYVITIRN
jgi:hypothetical protein